MNWDGTSTKGAGSVEIVWLGAALRMLKRDPEGALAVADSDWGFSSVAAASATHEPGKSLEQQILPQIESDPTVSPDYHWRRLMGDCLAIAVLTLFGMATGALTRWLPQSASLRTASVLLMATFLILSLWRAILHGVVGHGHRVPHPVAEGSWAVTVLALCLVASTWLLVNGIAG